MITGAWMRRSRGWTSTLLAAMAALAGGCTSPSGGPEVLTVPVSEYTVAFDAAIEAARRDGMPSVLRDRRGGVIETQPRIAGSILEPWRTDNASLDQSLENTVSFLRRRARFEFVPVGFVPRDDAIAESELFGPDVVNAQQLPFDLTQTEGELELRVWVYVEKGYIPGMRRSTWTRAKTTQAQLVYPEDMKDNKRGLTVYWSPSARDPDYEQRLLRQVQKMMQHPVIPEEPDPDSEEPKPLVVARE